MSQRIAIKSIVTKPTKKEGTNITTIEDEKGAKMSAFNDTALAQLHAGDILEVDIEVKGEYTNITSWKLIESKPAPPAPPAPAITTKEDWAEKDRITRASIERQVSLKCAVEARPGQTDTVIVASADTFYRFLSGQPAKEALFPPETSKTTIPPSSQPPAAQTGAVTGTPEHVQTFQNVGEFLAAALTKGYKTKVSIESKLGQKLELVKNLEEAYKLL